MKRAPFGALFVPTTFFNRVFQKLIIEDRSMKRVLVVGCAGAGKSTVAKELAEITGLPLIHLDRHYWLPGWEEPSRDAWRVVVESLSAQPEWIMDGTYSGTLQQRLARADTIIHLDYPTWCYLWRVILRTARGLGEIRGNELGPGCPERFDWQFLRYVIRYRRDHRERDLARMSGFSGKVYRFTTPSALASFVKLQRERLCSGKRSA
ncbi:adenylate kinase [Phyllobacterium pellucidum]|nr:adenylate kinase [Phyllobacterium pellucidum]